MRDGQIMMQQRANEKRAGLMLAQFSFLKTRQEAFEIVWAASTFFQRVTWMVKPARLIRRVDVIHGALLQKEREEMAAAAEKTKIHIVPAGVGV